MASECVKNVSGAGEVQNQTLGSRVLDILHLKFEPKKLSSHKQEDKEEQSDGGGGGGGSTWPWTRAAMAIYQAV